MDRRTILQTIGTGVSMGAFASPTAATPKDADPLTKLEIEAEELQSGDTRQYYTQVRTSLPEKRWKRFSENDTIQETDKIKIRLG